MSDELDVKFEQMQALLYYAGYYDGAIGHNHTNMTATLGALQRFVDSANPQNVKSGAFVLDIPALDAALVDLKKKIEGDPEIQKKIVYDAMFFLNGKNNSPDGVHIKTGRVLQGLGYSIENRKNYETAFEDFKLKVESSADTAPQKPQERLAKTFNKKAGPALPDAPPEMQSKYKAVAWSSIPQIQGAEADHYKGRFENAAGYDLQARFTGLLEIRTDGHLMFTFLDYNRDVNTYDVTNHFNDIPGLWKVPLSQEIVGMMNEELSVAQEIVHEGHSLFLNNIDSKIGVIEDVSAVIPGWGSLNDVDYELWIREENGEKQVRLVTDELYESGRADFYKAQAQTLTSLGTANNLNERLEKTKVESIKPEFSRAANGQAMPVSAPAINIQSDPVAEIIQKVERNKEQRIADPVYDAVDWSDIEDVTVTPDMKDALRKVAGVSDATARKGVLDITAEGRLILTRKIGEGESAKIVAHHVTEELDNILGLSEVPFSQGVFKSMADKFKAAKAMEGFDPSVGMTERKLGEIEGWGLMNDKYYDLWVREVDGKIKVSVVTDNLEKINGNILDGAKDQAESFDKHQIASGQKPAPEFDALQTW